MKNCPFCGRKMELYSLNNVYPSGFYWKEEHGTVTYDTLGNALKEGHFVPPEQWCWKVVCAEEDGGCGAEMHGNSKVEAVEKWNTRK